MKLLKLHKVIQKQLCAEKGITVTELMKLLGINPSSASRWKNKGYMPSKATAKKIADYFGITVSQLTKSEKEAPAKAEVNNEMNEMLEEIRRRPELKALFSLFSKAMADDINITIKL